MGTQTRDFHSWVGHTGWMSERSRPEHPRRSLLVPNQVGWLRSRSLCCEVVRPGPRTSQAFFEELRRGPNLLGF